MNGFTKLACAALAAGVGVFGGEAKAQSYGNYYTTPVYAPATNYGTVPCTTGNSWGQTIARPITATTNWMGQVVSPLFGGATTRPQNYYQPVTTGYPRGVPQTICGPNGCYVPSPVNQAGGSYYAPATGNCVGGNCPTPAWPTTYSTPNYQTMPTTPNYYTQPAYYTPGVGNSIYHPGVTVPVNYQSTGATSPFYQ